MAEYIQIWEPDGISSFKFGAVAGQWTRIFDKATSITRTIGGDIDVAEGSVYQTDQMTLKVRAIEDRAGYGTRAELEALYKFSRPGASVHRVTDHYGNTLYVKFVGRFNQRAITTIIDTDQAWYHIPVEFIVLPAYYRKLMSLVGGDTVVLLPLWEPSGSVLADVSGNDYDGVPGASVLLDQDGIGDGRRSCYFNEATVDISAVEPGMNYSAGGIILWTKPPSGGWSGVYQSLLRIWVDANNHINFDVGSSRPGMLVKAGGTGTAISKVSPGVGWQMLGMTWDADDAQFYFNGVPQGTPKATGTWAGTPSVLLLGALTDVPASPALQVYMAYLAIYSTRPTATQMLAAYNGRTR